MDLVERFNAKYTVCAETGCWLWDACTNNSGYGLIWMDGGPKAAHRVSWELHNGSIPPGSGAHGTCVCHKCDTPACVNPKHLWLGSNAENVADRDAKGRGHDRKGEKHPGAKLTLFDVLTIRDTYSKCGISQRALACLYGVSLATISAVILRKNWKHI